MTTSSVQWSCNACQVVEGSLLHTDGNNIRHFPSDEGGCRHLEPRKKKLWCSRSFHKSVRVRGSVASGYGPTMSMVSGWLIQLYKGNDTPPQSCQRGNDNGKPSNKGEGKFGHNGMDGRGKGESFVSEPPRGYSKRPLSLICRRLLAIQEDSLPEQTNTH